MSAPTRAPGHTRTVLVLTLVVAVLLQANAAVNGIALRITRRDALAARPEDFRFVDSYVAAAGELIRLSAVLSLVPAVTLLILAWMARASRRPSRWLLVGALATTAVWGVCGAAVNPGSALWTGPDEWDTVGGFVPAWQQPALLLVAAAVMATCVAAIVLLLRDRRDGKPGQAGA